MKELVLEVGVEGLPPAVISPALAEMRQLGEGSGWRTRYQEIRPMERPAAWSPVSQG